MASVIVLKRFEVQLLQAPEKYREFKICEGKVQPLHGERLSRW